MAKNKDPQKIDRGRRQFLKATGMAPIAASVAGAVVAEAQSGPALLGPGEVPIELNVNGKRIGLRVEPRVTLLNALRNRADLTGNKKGCDRGVCGACTMIIDGRTAYSCSTLAIETVGKQIRTVDGLADGAKLHPVQQAFCDRDALMCGFCTPGFVMAMVALLEKNPKPTVEQIKKGLDGNICRCGTFVRIQEAAMVASGQRLAPNTLGLGVTRG
ncbi:MAG TPA: (2Fe-2S)-binding protein [Vicinamibacterales bacterium]|nr:(2Fe-2S)-binding protein [Vicinamibacterales bacterium]